MSRCGGVLRVSSLLLALVAALPALGADWSTYLPAPGSMLFLRTGMTRLEVIDALKAHGLPPNSSALVCTRKEMDGDSLTLCEIDSQSEEWKALRPTEEPFAESFQFVITHERLVAITHAMRFLDGDRARMTARRVESTAFLTFGRAAVKPDKGTVRKLFDKGTVVEALGWNTPKSSLIALSGILPDPSEDPLLTQSVVIVTAIMTAE
jgi:hypothetical protein